MRSLTFLALLPLAACADASLSKSEDMSGMDIADTGGAGAPSDSDWSGGGGAADTADTAPPEEESDALRLTPAGTDAYVFVANPDRNTVTRIAVPSLAVLTTDVGDTPTAVQTTSDYAFAVTLNEGDDTLSIIDADTMVPFPDPEVLVESDDERVAMQAADKVLTWAFGSPAKQEDQGKDQDRREDVATKVHGIIPQSK
jgi:hypothetical protein